MAQQLGSPVNPDVVYAAGLAHDLGHPPFGHAGEKELQRVLTGFEHESGVKQPLIGDSFEGNAQTFRIVTRTAARKKGEEAGLNLSWRTYAAIAKYPWIKGQQPLRLKSLSNKWSAYDSERDYLQTALDIARDAKLMGTDRPLEAQVMDWSDDIAYAVHDLEDFFRAGLVPLNRLRRDRSAWRKFLEYAEKSISTNRSPDIEWDKQIFDKAANSILVVLPDREYHGNNESRAELHLFASRAIEALSLNIEINNSKDLIIPLLNRHQAEIMKKLTKHFVIERANVAFEQHGQRKIIRELFMSLHRLASEHFVDKDRPAGDLPERFWDYCKSAMDDEDESLRGLPHSRLARATCDFICSLTDRQAYLLAHSLSGALPTSSANWSSV